MPQNGLAARVLNPATGRTVMLALDHGYFQGPTSGLEEPRKTLEPLLPWCDAVSPALGVFLRCFPENHSTPGIPKRPAAWGVPVILRASGGNSIVYADPVELEREVALRGQGLGGKEREALRERIADDMVSRELSNEGITVPAAEARRLGAAGVSISIYVGARYQKESILNLARLAEEARALGVMTLGITAVGKEMARDARYLGLASRIAAEHGADIVKTYFCEGFEKVARGAMVPVVIAGGKKVPEREALEFCHQAMQSGAAGVDMGRNIFQSGHPVAMIQAVRAIVHGGLGPREARGLYEEMARDGAPAPPQAAPRGRG
ncbi:MAG: 3-hydroxy-5-phosphonooxypentane-2,4-dione thiolase LsrF [Candidatus Tectomicrobia bacterium]|nr:3-hydroxy-5-phosphonooxypentane-2,4-dione thiolase LsrF [Candidatus Tectomicrobia bacterium]